MNLNFITPKMSAVFGNLEFAGSGAVKSKRNNGNAEIISRTYNLYSDKERTDNVEVTLPPMYRVLGEAREKNKTR